MLIEVLSNNNALLVLQLLYSAIALNVLWASTRSVAPVIGMILRVRYSPDKAPSLKVNVK